MYAICHIKNYYCKCTNTKYKKFYLATGISVRCRPDAMNEKFRKVDTHLHGMYYGAKRPMYKCFEYVQIILQG